MRSRKTKIGAGLAVVCFAAIVLAALAASTRVQAAGPVGSGTASATKSVCGAGTGKKATGTPIKIGGIDMLIPGVDFTTIGKIVQAYFKCVNDNGGIKGHPIQYILYNEQLNPTQQAALARKLVESDKVVGIVGNTSFTECGTNWRYYKSKGFVVIGAGVQAECFGTPSYVESNMGPRYSNIGAAQALIRRRREVDRDRLAFDDLGLCRRRRRRARQGGRHPGARLPDAAPGHRRELDHPEAGAGCRPGRRRHPRLHA